MADRAADGGARRLGGRHRARHHRRRIVRVPRRRRAWGRDHTGDVQVGRCSGDGGGCGRVPEQGVPGVGAAGARGRGRRGGEGRVRKVPALDGGGEDPDREGGPEARGLSQGGGAPRTGARADRRRVGGPVGGGCGGFNRRRHRSVHGVRGRQGPHRVLRSNPVGPQQGRVHVSDAPT